MKKPREIPLGQSEDQQTEFKAAGALNDLYAISREVAAMLNSAKGGTVWIGLAEEGGRAVRIDPVPDVERQRGRLRDHLLDALEPSPRGEVDAESVDAGEGRSVIAVDVHPDPKRKPYAQVRGTARHFLTRVANRIRTMSREEVFGARGAAGGATDRLDAARREVRDERDAARKRTGDGLWVFIKPVEDLKVDIQGEGLAEMLCDPTLTGNRIDGWNFANPYEKPRLLNGKIQQLRGGGPGVEVRRTGEIAFAAPLRALRPLDWREDRREIYPICLLEYPTSIFRLASEIYRHVGASQDLDIIADLAMFKLKGWALRPYSPDTVGHLTREPNRYEEEDLALANSPILLDAAELMNRPDRCARRLLVLVYEAFLYGEDAIPSESDRATGKLEI